MFLRFCSSRPSKGRGARGPSPHLAAPLLTLLALSACGTTIDPPVDAGPDAPPVMTRHLEVEGDARLTLVFAEESELEVRLLDDERGPVSDALVSFSFDGRAHDSTLDVLSAQTDELGLARTTLTAGMTPGTFRVRVSAEDADPIFVEVAVSDLGFADLRVAPRYEGTRPVRLVAAAVFSDLDCSSPMTRRERGDRYQALGPDDDEANFVGLPLGVDFAVVGRAEGVDGSLLGWGCVDGVQVEADGPPVVVEIEDMPQQTEGSYEVRVAFPTTETAGVVIEELDALELASREAGGSALMLDAIEAQLLASGDTDAASRMARFREEGLDTRFVGSAVRGRVGLEAAFTAAHSLLGESMGALDVSGVLRVGPELLELDVREVGTGPDLETLRSLAVVDYAPGAEVSAAIDARGEELALEELSVFVKPSGLVRSIFRRAATEVSDEGTRTELWAGWMACDELPHPDDLASVCDRTCLIEACVDVAATMVATFDAQLELLDLDRSAVRLGGAVALEDETGDLVVDRVEGTLEGHWSGADTPRPERIDAELYGTRVLLP